MSQTLNDVSFESRLLDGVLALATDAIISLGPDGTIVGWNRMSERILGVGPLDAEGRSLFDVFPNAVHQQLARAVDTALSGKPVPQVQFNTRRKDGTPTALSLWGGPIMADSTGTTVAGALLMLRDVTEQQVALASSARAQLRIRGNQALASVGTWMWDITTDTVQWSDQCYRIHGVHPLAFDGTLAAYLETIHHEHRAVVSRELREAAAEDRPFEVVYRTAHCVSGSMPMVRARAQVLRGSDLAVLGLAGVAQFVPAGRGG